MEPVRIAISGSSAAALRQECKRLGIVGVAKNTHTPTLRRLLRRHMQDYMLRERWLSLAEALFGSNHDLDISTLDTLADAVHERLYQRLVDQHMVSREGNTLLRDEDNNQLFAITGRKTTRTVATRIFPLTRRSKRASRIGGCSILLAARIAFSDVNDTITAWEASKEST